MEKVEQDRHISSHDIDKKLLNIDYKTVLNHLEKNKKKLDVWVLYDLTMKNELNFHANHC